ncbi:MAG: hypothetical protein SNJ71_01195, partial [Bacteroidales bacterium]
HLGAPITSPHTLNSKIPVSLSQIIEKLLSKQQADRYNSAISLKYDIEKALEHYQNNTIFDNVLNNLPIHVNFKLKSLSHYISDFNKYLKKTILSSNEHSKVSIINVTGTYSDGINYIGKFLIDSLLHEKYPVFQGVFYPGTKNIPFHGIQWFLNETAIFLKSSNIFEKKDIILFFNSFVNEEKQLILRLYPDFNEYINCTINQDFFEYQYKDISVITNIIIKILKYITATIHPCIIFVENLKYLDNSSLKIFLQLYNNPTLSHIVFVNFTSEIKTISTGKTVLYKKIPIHRFSAEEIADILSETFGWDLQYSIEPAFCYYKLSKGAPALLLSLINHSIQNKYIYFDKERYLWKYTISELHNIQVFSENNFITQQVWESQDEQMFNALYTAAHLGVIFDLRLVAPIINISLPQLYLLLTPAIENGIIARIASLERERTYPPILFRFVDYHVVNSLSDNGNYNKNIISQIFNEMLCQKEIFSAPILLNEPFIYYNYSLVSEIPPEYQIHIISLSFQRANLYLFLNMWDYAERYSKYGLSLIKKEHWKSNYQLCDEVHFLSKKLAFYTKSFDKIPQILQNAFLHCTSDDINKYLLIKGLYQLEIGHLSQSEETFFSIIENLNNSSIKLTLFLKKIFSLLPYSHNKKDFIGNKLDETCSQTDIINSIIFLHTKKILPLVHNYTKILIVRQTKEKGIFHCYVLVLLHIISQELEQFKTLRKNKALSNNILNLILNNPLKFIPEQLYYFQQIAPFLESSVTYQNNFKSFIIKLIENGYIKYTEQAIDIFIIQTIMEGNNLKKVYYDIKEIKQYLISLKIQTNTKDRLEEITGELLEIISTSKTIHSSDTARYYKIPLEENYFNHNLFLMYASFFEFDTEKTIICANNCLSVINNKTYNYIIIKTITLIKLVAEIQQSYFKKAINKQDFLNQSLSLLGDLYGFRKHLPKIFLAKIYILQAHVYLLQEKPDKYRIYLQKSIYFAEKYKNYCILAVANILLSKHGELDKKEFNLYIIKAYNALNMWGAGALAHKFKLHYFSSFEDYEMKILNIV